MNFFQIGENMDEETLLRRKILDTANKSYNQNNKYGM